MRLPTNAELEEMLFLEQAVKRMTAQIQEIKDLCKEAGSFATDKFVCAVTLQNRTGLLGLKEVEKALGREILEKNDLIKTTTFQVVKVAVIEENIECKEG